MSRSVLLIGLRITVASALLSVLLLGACDRGVIAEDAGAASDSDVTQAEDATAPVGEDGATASADAGAKADTGPQGTEPETGFELGTNVTGKNTPSAFTPIDDGGDIQVELGFQGAYMVVLAFRSRGYATKKLTVRASIGAGGKTLGAITLKGKTSINAPNGWSYYYNLFVITEGWEDLVDGPATATVTLEDGDGAVIVSESIKGTLRAP